MLFFYLGLEGVEISQVNNRFLTKASRKDNILGKRKVFTKTIIKLARMQHFYQFEVFCTYSNTRSGQNLFSL